MSDFHLVDYQIACQINMPSQVNDQLQDCVSRIRKLQASMIFLMAMVELFEDETDMQEILVNSVLNEIKSWKDRYGLEAKLR